MRSKQVRLSIEAQEGMYKGFAGITAYHFTRAPIDTGILALHNDRLTFSGASDSMTVPFSRLRGATIESNTMIVISADHGPLFFDFVEESGKKWEDLILMSLRKHHAPEEILEFYPRIRLRSSLKEKPARICGHKVLRVPQRRWYSKDTSPLPMILKPIARLIIKPLFKIEIQGLDNIPPRGPAILLPNHTSFLDSVILGFFTSRNVWFMAKNSEYHHPFMKWFLRHASSFPVRRYTIDVLAVRNAIRVVQQGHILGIFPEGERTWEGEMLPFKTGTMRLILALGVPVLPVGISGAYELMPRWTSSIKRVPVKVAIGQPLIFPHIPIPKQTRTDIETASILLRSEIERLSGCKT
ncbi:MAG: 1-acyl-sn-glycerol-3-phosphate acyltransferase [Desulfobacterota bacterium]|nr:1-acyl-sn-glycerol-3-phosphate acyltransferase [Thermodesulfobacteriota bacterium]